MNNFKIACANLKDPYISSLRMPHFKIAHISTLLATCVDQGEVNQTGRSVWMCLFLSFAKWMRRVCPMEIS